MVSVLETFTVGLGERGEVEFQVQLSLLSTLSQRPEPPAGARVWLEQVRSCRLHRACQPLSEPHHPQMLPAL